MKRYMYGGGWVGDWEQGPLGHSAQVAGPSHPYLTQSLGMGYAGRGMTFGGATLYS